MVLKTSPELVSGRINEPAKRMPLVHTTTLLGDSSSTESSPVEDAVKPLPETKPNPELQLRHVSAGVLAPMSGAKKLRKMLQETDELIVCPGVYDGLSARTAIELEFSAMYMTGAGTTASRLGQPDLAIAQLHDMRDNAEMIANLDPFGPPLIADMDTGYGGELTWDTV
ncbi:hypothetical protein SLS62_009387 [Diatrype stigma]|uniref:Carboxyphosphonoenolpyruvate phosphonomutase n=1 Tax=Diatrype stigma TaxID=117547 RepID=A0AAN9YKW6_9PEZI